MEKEKGSKQNKIHPDLFLPDIFSPDLPLPNLFPPFLGLPGFTEIKTP